MTIEEFGKKTKEKYPQYSSYSDVEIGNKMLEKYPVYKDSIIDSQPNTTPINTTQSSQGNYMGVPGKVVSNIVGGVANVVKGAGKQVIKDVQGLAAIPAKAVYGAEKALVLNPLAKAMGTTAPSYNELPGQGGKGATEVFSKEKLTPQGKAQKTGATIGQIGEFLAVPEASVEKLGTSGVVKLAEKGLISPETLTKVSNALGSKYGQFAVQRLQDASVGATQQFITNIASGEKATKDIGSSAGVSLVLGPVFRGVADKLGKVLGKTLADTIGIKTENEAKQVVNAVNSGDSNLLKHLVGEKGAEFVNAGKNTYAHPFYTGEKTVNNIVRDIDSAAKEYSNQSKKSLMDVKNRLSNTNVNDRNIIASKVNDAVMNTISGNAEYRGVAANLKSIKDLENYGIIHGDEAKKVKGVMKYISDWKDMSDRGVLNLKENLDTFYKSFSPEHTTGKKIVQNIQENLKGIVHENNPELQGVLQKSSDDIKFMENIKSMFGTKKGTAESKVKTFLNQLKDVTLNEQQINALKKLDEATGYKYDILNQALGYKDYNILKEFKDPGIFGGDKGFVPGLIDKARYHIKKTAVNLPTK